MEIQKSHLALVPPTQEQTQFVPESADAGISEVPGGVMPPRLDLHVVPDIITSEDVPNTPEISPAHHTVAELGTSEGYETFIASCKQELEGHDMQGIDRLMKGREKMIDNAVKLIREDARKLNEYNRVEKIADRNVDTAISLYGQQAVDRYKQLQKELYVSRYGNAYVIGEEGDKLARDLVAGSTNPSYEDVDQPRQFIQSEQLDKSRIGYVVLETNVHDNPIDIPISMIVSAERMSDWEGTGGWPEKVKKFTALPAETYPPIDELTGYLLPDGRLYFSSQNAHRACAAVQRGDKSIRFSGMMRVNVLEEIPEALKI
jgi:hypothetical protein